MIDTIENRITSLLTERLRQHMVSGFIAFVPEGMPNSNTAAKLISVSGSLSQDYPRSFLIEVTDVNTVTINETTLFADKRSIVSTAIESLEIVYVDGVPFDVGDSGLAFTIGAGAKIGMIWNLRAGHARYTVARVEDHPIDYEQDGTPSLSIYASGNQVSKDEIVGLQSNVLSVAILLSVSPEEHKKKRHLEIIGDVNNCINRDFFLFDNEICLSSDLDYEGAEYFEQTDRGNSIFIIAVKVKFRTKLKDSRSK
jgi:hypothetical protein